MSAQKPSTQVNVAASKGIMRPINRFLEQWIPSALTFAIVLTLIVAVLALIFTDAGPGEVVIGWGEGLAGLLEFMTQMCLILLLGHILANTGPVRSLLAGLARVPGNATFTYVFVFLVAAVASLITWGLGLVVGALLAREIAVQSRERGIMSTSRCWSPPGTPDSSSGTWATPARDR